MKERDDLHSIAWKSICKEIHGRSMTKKEVAEVRKQSNYRKCIKGVKSVIDINMAVHIAAGITRSIVRVMGLYQRRFTLCVLLVMKSAMMELCNVLIVAKQIAPRIDLNENA